MCCWAAHPTRANTRHDNLPEASTTCRRSSGTDPNPPAEKKTGLTTMQRRLPMVTCRYSKLTQQMDYTQMEDCQRWQLMRLPLTIVRLWLLVLRSNPRASDKSNSLACVLIDLGEACTTRLQKKVLGDQGFIRLVQICHCPCIIVFSGGLCTTKRAWSHCTCSR